MAERSAWEPKPIRETDPCSFPSAETTIRDYYALRPDRRAGTLAEVQIDDLLKIHAAKERCPHCLLLIQQLSEQEKLDEERERRW